MLFLGDDAPLGVPLPGGHRDRVAADSAGADQVAGLRARLAVAQSALEILPPQRSLAATRQEPHVVGGILILAELVLRGTVVLEPPDHERSAAADPQLSPA